MSNTAFAIKLSQKGPSFRGYNPSHLTRLGQVEEEAWEAFVPHSGSLLWPDNIFGADIAQADSSYIIYVLSYIYRIVL